MIEKTLANAFADTALQDTLAASGRQNLIVIGFMTHNCVSSLARDAGDAGHTVVVACDAAATRALPGPNGTVIAAAALHAASLAGLGDRFARLADVAEILAAG